MTEADQRRARSAWFWFGFACLIAALTGWIDWVSPGVQFLLIGMGYMAMRLNTYATRQGV